MLRLHRLLDDHAPGHFTVTLAPDETPRPVIARVTYPRFEARGETRVDNPRYDVELTLDGVRRQIVLAAGRVVNPPHNGDDWWAQTTDGPLRITALPLLPEPRRAAGAGGSLRAPLPGTVLAVLVEVGQSVAEGEALVKLEAMKMEYTIRAAAAGVVTAIHYTPGDSVTAGQALVILEAMKMENEIRAPFDGVVSSVTATVGQSAPRGQLLVEVK